jgi:hypothetical protein
MKHYQAGAFFGAVVGLLVYLFVPIYSDLGPASILPTGNVVSNDAAYNSYVSNLPFSIFIWLALEVLGVAAGIIGQMIIRKNSIKGLQ